jgi:ABC-type sugar transport system permease subunit
MFLAALQEINPALYEAAKIDGGHNLHVFHKITITLWNNPHFLVANLVVDRHLDLSLTRFSSHPRADR